MAYPDESTQKSKFLQSFFVVAGAVIFTAISLFITFMEFVAECNRNLLFDIVLAAIVIALLAIYFGNFPIQKNYKPDFASVMVVIVLLIGIAAFRLFSTDCISHPSNGFGVFESQKCYIRTETQNQRLPVRSGPSTRGTQILWYFEWEDGEVEVIGSSEGSVNIDRWWKIRSNNGTVGWIWSGSVDEDTFCDDIIRPDEGVRGSRP